MELDYNLTHKAVRRHAYSFLNNLLNVLLFEQQKKSPGILNLPRLMDPDFPSAGLFKWTGFPSPHYDEFLHVSGL